MNTPTYTRPIRVNRFILTQLAILLAAGSSSAARADVYFNPRFLADDPTTVADLSSFQKGLEVPPGSYRVDIYMNEKYIITRDVPFEISDDGESLQPCLTQKQLSGMGVNTLAIDGISALSSDACIPLKTLIKDASTSFDVGRQRLYISIPQAYMSNRPRGYISPEFWDNGIDALTLNYSFNGNDVYSASGDSRYAYLNLQSGLNLGAWRLRDNSTWSYQSDNRNNPSTRSEWQHVNTYLERGITSLHSRLTIGDSSTSGNVFEGINFRGIQLASDDNMLPESQKGFAPVIRGIAKGPALISVKQNGYLVYETNVSAGPFTINDLYAVGNGDLQVTVKETDGSTQIFTVPYSSVPLLQREGQMKYALTVGEFRSGSNQQENPRFFQGTILKGLPAGWTVYGGTQLSNDYRAFQLGVGKNLGSWGAISTDITQANSTLPDESNHQGQSIRFMYNKSLNDVGTNIQLIGYRYSTQGYFTLSDTAYRQMESYSVNTQDGIIQVTPQYTDYYNLAYTKRGRLQVGLTQQISNQSSMYLSGSHQTYWGTNKADQQVQVGYSATRNYITYNLSYSLTENAWQEERDQMLAFSINIPFSQWLRSDSKSSFRRSNVNYSNSNDMKGRATHQAGIYGTLLEDDNLSYNIRIGYASGGEGVSGNTSNLALSYRGAYGNVNLGYSDDDDYRKFYYGLNGGLILHANGVTLSQPLNNTVVLVKAPGASRVSIENQVGVRTDRRGYAVVPYAMAYQENRIALNTETLANNIDLDEPVVNVVPTQGAVVPAEFKAHVGVKVLMNLVHKGKPVPFGSTVTWHNEKSGSIVADEGQVYLTGLPLQGQLIAKWGDSAATQCVADYSLPSDSKQHSISYATANCN